MGRTEAENWKRGIGETTMMGKHKEEKKGGRNAEADAPYGHEVSGE
jgi:hypothetical protein